MKPRSPLPIVFFLGLLAPWSNTCLALEPGLPPDLAAADRLFRSAGPETALPEFERLLAEYRNAGDRATLARVESMLGECHWQLGEFDKAEDYLLAARALSRELGDLRQEGRALNLLGLVRWDRGDFDSAIEHFTAASDIAQEVGDLRMQGATLNNLSLVLDELGEYETSLQQYERALAIYAQTDFPRGRGDTLGNIGGVHLLLGRYSEAVRYYQQALELSRQLDSLPSQSQDHGNLGYAYTGLGQFDLALHHFKTALEFAERAGMPLEQGYWMRGMGDAELRMGRPDLALVHNRAALEIYRSSGAESLLLEGLHDFGQLMLELGDPVSAEQSFREAIDLARSTRQSRGITHNLLALGHLQLRQGHFEEASALYRQALARAEESGERALTLKSLLSSASLHMVREDFSSAHRDAIGALSTAQEIQSLPGTSEARLIIAGTARARGDFKGAITEYAAIEPLIQELGDPDLAWQMEYGRALALIGLGERSEAVEALQAAVEHIESVRGRLKEKRFRTGYLQDKHQVYIELVRLQLEMGLHGDALTTAERLRTLSFSQQIGSIRGKASDAHTPYKAFELQERIRQLQRAIGEERSLPVPQQREAAIRHFSRELLVAEQQYQAWLDDRISSAEAVPWGQETDAADLLHARLGNREALIEYVVANNDVIIFVVRRDRLWATTRTVEQDNLRSQIQLLRDLIQQKDSTRWLKPAHSLAQNLIEPIVEAGWLEDVERLYLVPHGELNYLPFAVLPHSGQIGALVDRYILAYLPTALALSEGRKIESEHLTLLGVAPTRSRLRYASEEARSITQLFEPRSRMLSGAAATESLFAEIAPDYQVLHLATHGYFNKFNPLLSGLELEADGSNDGLLEVHEILRLRLSSHLVTLSACDTGLGSGYFTEIPAGDDFVGMTRAFLQAGSAAVLASLWEVDDRSTVDLMKQFYGQWVAGQTANKALALASAQRDIKSRREYRHPYFWAPFILVGSMDAGPAIGI